jgi:hypothetical protein
MRFLALILVFGLTFGGTAQAQTLTRDQARVQLLSMINALRADPAGTAKTYGFSLNGLFANTPGLQNVDPSLPKLPLTEHPLLDASGQKLADLHLTPAYQGSLTPDNLLNGEDPTHQCWDQGYIGNCGQNLSAGGNSPVITLAGLKQAFLGLVFSPEHLAAMLSPSFSDIGIGMAIGAEGPYPNILDIVTPFGAPTLTQGGSSRPTSGWYWVQGQPGQGYMVQMNDAGRAFFAAYIYDSTGNPRWYAANLSIVPGGQYMTGSLITATGGAPLGQLDGPSLTGQTIGTVSFGCSQIFACVVQWPQGFAPAGSSNGNTYVTRFPFNGSYVTVPAATPAFTTGWYWNPANTGQGVFIETQGNQAIVTATAFDRSGKPIWYVGSFNVNDPTSFAGTMATYVITNGQAQMVDSVPTTFNSTANGLQMTLGNIIVPLVPFQF